MAELMTLPAILADCESDKYISPDEYSYWKLAENRTFYIVGDELFAEDFLEIGKQILLFNKEDQGKKPEDRIPIKVLIYTYGGDLHGVYSLISTIISSTTPVITVNMGLCYSSGGLLLMAGHKRYCLRLSQALVHQGSGGACGTFSEMEASQANYKKLVAEMKQYILSRTKITEAQYKKQQSKDWYISDVEQIEYGIVDGYLDSLEDIL